MKKINDLLTSKTAMTLVQDFLQTEDDDARTSTLEFLSHLLIKFYAKADKEESKGRNMFLNDLLASINGED